MDGLDCASQSSEGTIAADLHVTPDGKHVDFHAERPFSLVQGAGKALFVLSSAHPLWTHQQAKHEVTAPP